VEVWAPQGILGRAIHLETPSALDSLHGGSMADDHDFTCHMIARSGATVHLHCVAKTTFCEGNSRELHGFMMDITELKVTQESLARHSADLSASNAELRQFASVASHDLREPLRMVSFYTPASGEALQGKLDADADEFIGYALEGATRMGDLINNLLEYSRVSARTRDIAPANCEAIFEQSMKNLRLAVTESRAIVEHDPLPVILGDVSQLGPGIPESDRECHQVP